jgi:hypothetical protein
MPKQSRFASFSKISVPALSATHVLTGVWDTNPLTESDISGVAVSEHIGNHLAFGHHSEHML